MENDDYKKLHDKIDQIHESVTEIKRELYELRTTNLPILFRQSSQQVEYLDILLNKLQLNRGWLPPTRGWAASPDFLLIVANHVLNEKPPVTVECGSGTSSLVIARCLQLNGQGHLYSLEHDDTYAEKTRASLSEKGLDTFSTIIHAPLTGIRFHDIDFQWYALEGLPDLEISCLIIDGPPIEVGPFGRYPAGPMLFHKLASKAVIFLDDFDREDEKRTFRAWRKEHPHLQASSEITEKGCGVLRRID